MNNRQSNKLWVDIRLKAETTYTTQLYYIIQEFLQGTLVSAPHQRDYRWSEEKEREFINRMRIAPGKMPGCIETYQLTGEFISLTQLNDGRQRIGAAINYYNNPQEYGDSQDDAKALLQAVQYPVNHHHYKTHEEAFTDFQYVNYGLIPTAYEHCRGVLVYLDVENFSSTWEVLFDKLHDMIKTESYRIVEGAAEPRKDAQVYHNVLRHDISLFYRFVSKERAEIDYRITESKLKMQDIRNKKVVEWKLRILLDDIGLESANNELDRFAKFIRRETATLLSIIHNENGDELGYGVTRGFYRWFLDVAIWKYNNNATNDDWEAFLVQLYNITKGKASIPAEIDGRISTHPLGMSRVNRLSAACELIGSDFFDIVKKKKRRKRRIVTLPGFDESHVNPLNYDSDVFPEPAGRNRARGAQPVITNY